MRKKEILKQLNASCLFTDKIKKQIGDYFDRLNQKQIDLIADALENEKTMLLDFLRSLKDRWELDFVEVKTIKESIAREQRNKLETNEEQDTQIELDQLLYNLDNI